ncbi:MAG: DUF2905 domain-containing protein [Actinomycetia bacterium]|nr:DUF2905 domain-containing protein [Actinomycetes bacterium]
MERFGKYILIIGIILTVTGIIILFLNKIGTRTILPRLPGDIYIKKDGFVFYFPLGWSILFSLTLTVLLNIVFSFLRK